MDHPIVRKDQVSARTARRSLGDLLKKCDLVRRGTIIFVCGGNEATDARQRFLKFAATELRDYDLFTPEAALNQHWQSADGPFELTKFEELVANVSIAVIIFPESPGSFCETGWFCAKDELVKKTFLVINSIYQRFDSFISTGPLHRVNESSDFRPALFLDYNGNFQEIFDRIKHRKPYLRRKAVGGDAFNRMGAVEKLGLIQKTVHMLRIATSADVFFCLKAIYAPNIAEREVMGLIAILRGSEYLLEVSEYGHLQLNPSKPTFLDVRMGSKGEETRLQFEIASLIEADSDFKSVLGTIAP